MLQLGDRVQLLGEVEDIDLSSRTVTSKLMAMHTVLPFDSLIVAAGALVLVTTAVSGLDYVLTYSRRAAMAAGLPTVITPNDFTAEHDFKGALRICPSLQDVGLAQLREWHHTAFKVTA